MVSDIHPHRTPGAETRKIRINCEIRQNFHSRGVNVAALASFVLQRLQKPTVVAASRKTNLLHTNESHKKQTDSCRIQREESEG